MTNTFQQATHLSDFLEHQDWLAGTKCKQAIRHFKERSFIGDAQSARFARKKSKSDAEIVDPYTDWAKGKKQCYGVLGLHEAEDLAKLEDGALAALDNADSYACYAAGKSPSSLLQAVLISIVSSDIRQARCR